MAVPPDTVELTCSREVCHVVYVIPRDELRELLGTTCPECRLGVLVLRDHEMSPGLRPRAEVRGGDRPL